MVAASGDRGGFFVAVPLRILRLGAGHTSDKVAEVTGVARCLRTCGLGG